MPYGTLNAGTITPGSGNTLTIDETVDGTAIKDEDAMGSNSATHLATQQSIKAYVDTTGTNSSITTLGTVSAGTWEATDVAVAHGGTGASTHTANNVLIGAGTSALTSIAPGADGQVLTSTGTVWNSESVPAGGKILQVLQTVKTDTYSDTANSGTFGWIPGLTASINPSSTSSKILFQASITGGSQTHAIYYKIQHNGSGSYADITNAIGAISDDRSRITSYGLAGTSDDAEMQSTIILFLDSPSKDSSFTYRVGGSARTGGNTWTINRPYADTDANYTGRSISTIVLMEIQG